MGQVEQIFEGSVKPAFSLCRPLLLPYFAFFLIMTIDIATTATMATAIVG